jgi:hypothetical protein
MGSAKTSSGVGQVSLPVNDSRHPDISNPRQEDLSSTPEDSDVDHYVVERKQP